MECRRTVVTGGILRSPPSASASPLMKASNPSVMRNRSRHHSRSYDCGDNIVDEYNNNSNITAVTTINNTTQLIDELEQLRTDNFQLRLRVYNAERRVDRLSAAALARDRKKRSDISDTESDDTDANSSHAGSGTDHNNAASKATAEAAVRTIHDLLTVNRRLLALLAATVSAKAVSVSTDDKRRWQRLRNHIEKYAADDPIQEKTNENYDENHDEFQDASTTDSETSCKARIVSADRSATRHNVQRSPPPAPQQSPLSTPLETADVDDEGAGSEVSRLRGRCRRLERSLQQLVNTELWARNRQIGKLEQQRYVTQAAQRDRRPADQAVVTAVTAPPQQNHLQHQIHSKAMASTASPQMTKGILVIRSTAETPLSTAKTPAIACMESQTATVPSPSNVTSITTPPPVLPDYSEVNFFFSCDEEDDDDDDYDLREDSAGTNCISSSEEETANLNECRGDEEPVRLAAVDAPVASSTSTRKRHCRPHHRQPQQPIKSVGDSATVTTTMSSSAESTAADELDKLNGSGVIMTTTTATSACATRRHRTVSGGGGLHRRRRCRPPRRCSTCGRCNGSVDVATSNRPRQPSVADAQVQCGDENVAVNHSCNNERGDSELQLQQLRRELDSRRRENGRLYDMLLRLQRGTRPSDRGNGDGGPRIPSPDFSDSDPSGSPKPYRQAARVVRGRVADLLPPLLSMRSISDDDDDNDGGGESHQRYRPDGAEQQQHQQQQQQLQLLTRLRERIVAYERRELNGGDDRVAAVVQQSADPSDDAVRSMDRTDLVNVALPRVVERLRRALVPLLQHRTENVVTAASARSGSVNGER